MAGSKSTLSSRSFLGLRDVADVRAVVLVLAYLSLLGAMYLDPAFRTVPFFLAACYLSFVNTIVLHSSLHKGPFRGDVANRFWRVVLSFGSLYPASANVPAHNHVHHALRNGKRLDWADPRHVDFRWNLLNLLHFPNVIGPNTFFGVGRWARRLQKAEFRRQFALEQAVAFGCTGALLLYDFWAGLFFVVIPQLWGARGVLRLNHIQHDGCDLGSRWNHSRNFTGRLLNWFMCNDGYHTIHHNKAGLHWSTLPERHARDVVPHIDPRLNEPSMLAFLFRSYGLNRRVRIDTSSDDPRGWR